MGVGQKILIVDNDESFLNTAKKDLGGKFDVVTAKTREGADKAILTHFKQFAVAIINISLESDGLIGIKLASDYKNLYPRMGIILIGDSPVMFEYLTTVIDDSLIKPFDISLLSQVVRNVIYKINMPYEIRKRRFELLHNLPGRLSVIFKNREPRKEIEGGDVEGINGICIIDGKEIRWVVYDLPEHEDNTFTIGVVISIGCKGRCQFCLSGKRKFVRNLTTDEIIGQVLLGLDSYHAQGVFREKRILKPYVNFTCEGDVLTTNIDNTAKAVERLADIEELGINFIITSIGDEEGLELFLKKYCYLPRTKHYWSVNSLNREFRAELMPSTKKHSLRKMRDLYQEIAEKTGENVTVSWMLIKGRNDTEGDIEMISEFFGGSRPFELKIQPLEGIGLPKFVSPSQTDLENFKARIDQLGISCRIRRVVGTEILAGCGTTVPTETLHTTQKPQRH